MVDYRLLLTKYVAHVAAAEGEAFATSYNIAPCDMLNLEFTEEELVDLGKVFSAYREWHKTITPDQRIPLSLEKLFDE